MKSVSFLQPQEAKGDNEGQLTSGLCNMIH